MSTMNANEIKNTARQNTIALIMPVLADNNAIRFADASFAIPQEVDGVKVWTEISVKTKAYKDTKTAKAFDPERARDEWQADLEVKAHNKAVKDAEKAEKLAKAGK